MKQKFDTFLEAAASMELAELPEEFYLDAVRLDGQMTKLGMNKSRLEDAKYCQSSTHRLETRMDRIGHYQYDHGIMLFCNQRGEIYAKRAKGEEFDKQSELFRKYKYKNAKNQDPWYPGSLYTAYVNSTLDKKIGNKLFKPVKAKKLKHV